MVAKRWSIVVLMVIVVGFVGGCDSAEEATTEPEAPAQPSGTSSFMAAPRTTAGPRGGADVALEHIQRMEGSVLATVNGEEITWEEYEPALRQALYSITEQYRLDWYDPAMKERLGHFQNDVLEKAVDRVLVRQMAIAEGIEVSEADVEARIEQEKSRMLSSASEGGWDDFLAANGLTDSSYRQYIRDGMVLEELALRQEAESQADQVHIRYITIADEEKAQTVFKELKAGADFAEMAKLYSEDPESRDKGGDLGWFTPEVLPDEIEEVALTLEPGQFSDPIVTEARHIIIQVVERAMRDLEAPVVAQLQQQALQARLKAERSSAQIEYQVEFSTSQGE